MLIPLKHFLIFIGPKEKNQNPTLSSCTKKISHIKNSMTDMYHKINGLPFIQNCYLFWILQAAWGRVRVALHNDYLGIWGEAPALHIFSSLIIKIPIHYNVVIFSEVGCEGRTVEILQVAKVFIRVKLV